MNLPSSPTARRPRATATRGARRAELPSRHPRRTAGETPLIARLRVTVFDAILDAAEDVFSAHGAQHGRMEQIAARAGVSVGTLYNHFRNRRALLDALLESRRAILLESVDAALADRALTFEARVDAFLGAIFSHVATHRALIAILLQEDASRPPLDSMAGAARPSAMAAALQSRAERLMRDGLKSGALERERPEILARALMGMTRSLLILALSAREPEAPGAGARRVARIFLEGAARP
jgi:AcrR family transcriptional regulator